ncbi:MAG: CBS domain-containing protein [Chloroflexi bacterium]|nr:CBS domain-containing protein [Chloroflexota bacterium]
MQKYKFHHLPIADENGILIGIISARDILCQLRGRVRKERNKNPFTQYLPRTSRLMLLRR